MKIRVYSVLILDLLKKKKYVAQYASIKKSYSLTVQTFNTFKISSHFQ